MTRSGTTLPCGFLGPVRTWGSLVPSARKALELPRERARWDAADHGGPFDLIEVRAVTESFGRIETALRRFTDALQDGGVLLLDVDNLQSPRMLRLVIEGRPGCFDPSGSTEDPSMALPLRRVLAAAAAAGLWIQDVVAVPTGAEEFPASLAQALFANGLMPLEWLDGDTPARFWLICQKSPLKAGSVLLAGGDAAARARTMAALATFLPADWEVVQGEGERECAQWNRALASARGELVWFLRGGCEPTAATFAALGARAGVGAVAPGVDGVRAHAGDISGLMLPRLDVLQVGPLPEHLANSAVGLEEYAMRLDGKLPSAELVDTPFVTPPPATEAPRRFAAEAQALIARWSPVQKAPDATEALAQPLDTRNGGGRDAADRARSEHGTDRSRPSHGNGTRATAALDAVRDAAAWRGPNEVSDAIADVSPIDEPRITLCMIARDEERFLPECLARAKDVVDEIVIVDTGSKDRTVAIAESYGAKVLHTVWDDDFSAPRNLGLREATGDWILVLDADEFLQPDAAERIRALVRNDKALGYHLHFVNLYDGGKTLGVMMVRLFRNLPGIAYENVIHEQVTPSLQRLGAPLGLVLLGSDIEVEHHGYTSAVMDQRGKNERNERLFKKQLQRTPDDVYGHYKYGDFLRRVPGRGADARRLLDRCLELILGGPPTLPRGLPYAGEVAALCALEAGRVGDNDRAREVIDVALRRFVPTPNLHYLAASVALADGRAEDAILHYRRCLAYRGQVLVVPIQDGITGHVSLAGIAQAWMLRGQIDRAQRLLEQAIALEPDYEVAHLALSRLFLQRGDNTKALAVLGDFLATHPDAPGALQQTTLILHRLGQTDTAKRLGRHAVQQLEARALDHEAKAMNQILAAM